MKNRTFFSLALIAFLATENANAGAAVAISQNDQLATAYGGPMKREEQRALAEARRRYGPNVRLLAATDVTGYGAIAVARHPGHGWLVGVSLGNRSASEAHALAIHHCLKAGGINPQVKWAFRG